MKPPHSFTLFSSIEQLTPKDQCLEEVRRILQGQFEFNKLLAEQIMKSDSRDFLEINASFFFSDYQDIDFTKMLSENSEDSISLIKKSMVGRIFEDIKRYKNLIEKIGDGNIDYLYVCMVVIYKIMVEELPTDAHNEGLSQMFEFFRFGEAEAKKRKKKILKQLRSNKLDTPLTAELRVFKECITLLKYLLARPVKNLSITIWRSPY